MKIYLYLANKFVTFTLPTEISGSFSFDENEEEDDKLINVEARDNKWYLYSTNESKIMENYNFLEEVELESDRFYTIKRGNYVYLIYAIKLDAKQINIYHYDSLINLQIGINSDCNVIYECPLLQTETIKIYIKENQLTLERGPHIPIYINNKQVQELKYIFKTGDQIEILGLRLIFLPGILIISAPKNKLTVKELLTKLADYKYTDDPLQTLDVKERTLYNENDYFSKAPRLTRTIETKEIKLSPPPSLMKSQELPLILTIGPMLTIGGMAGITLINTIYRLSTGEIFLEQVWPSLAMSLIMLISMTLWPLLTKMYNKKMKEKQRKELEEKYSMYLEEKKNELIEESKLQREILNENLVTTENCYNVIKAKDINFWNKRTDQNDFLKVRIGTGKALLDVKIEYPEEGFTIEEDNLRKMADQLVEEFKYIENVPLGYSFYENKITAIMGDVEKRPFFINNMLVQLLSFYTYEDLKLVIFTTKRKENNWNYIKYLNHNFNNERTFRFFASTPETAKKLSEYLNIIVLNRKEHYDKLYDKSYYLVIVDDYDLVKRQEFFKEISESENDLGFSLVLLEDRLSKLPSKCNNFINIGLKTSGVLQNSSETQEQITFTNEINETINMNELIPLLANVPIEFEYENNNLPSSISFLEMEKVGKVEQLSILNRWNTNDATSSLRAEIGMGEDGELMYLDLHEKYHGPHGLIAGMTGSGKSELIITYILSMAINYSPDDVAFILIDYKGGGLAFAFSNESTGMVLPHIAGVITNLDEAEINRSLASIESETKRRQIKFNEAKDLLGESTLDIYKYQSYYKEGKLEEAIPHLFIICDEFAELKSQQPEFMDKLISIARIGRSLGIHLILATQKPSGVVNDQIWSNSKFHICLKVQSQSDSNEMLKRPDAALLKETGRFYLQVGYDEYFALGQSAWSGAKYYPSDKIVKQIDRSVNFINDNGIFVKRIQMDDGIRIKSQGEQLTVIMKSIMDVAKKTKKKAKRLWLDSLKGIILESDLEEKYHFKKEPYKVEAIIGEYDVPEMQKQGLLKYSLLEQGNTLIYSIDIEEFEMVLDIIIYSTITNYTSEEINYYIFDYGSRSLSKFARASHIGGIVYPGENEKYHNLFKLIKEVIEERKKLLADYGGDYQQYIKENNKRLPLITIVLNNYDAMQDLDNNLYDDLPDLIRGSEHYGIIFIITAIGISSVPRRIAQNLQNTYILKVKDPTDYISAFGIRKKIIPSKVKGRGIFSDETLHEFQTASIQGENKNINEYLRYKIQDINQQNPVKAKKIPELPEQVKLEDVEQEINDLSNVPIGLNIDDLEINTYDFATTYGTIIIGNRLKNYLFFINSLIDVFTKIPEVQVIIFDPMNLLPNQREKIANYYSNNFTNVLPPIANYILRCKEESTKSQVIFIVGINKLLEQLNNPTEFATFLETTKKYDNAHIIITDDVLKLKKYSFEKWYTDNFYTTEGIYVGKGVTDQTTLKISNYNPELMKPYKNNIGFHIVEGSYKIVKLIEFERNGDDKDE